jgi:hypothetical protein
MLDRGARDYKNRECEQQKFICAIRHNGLQKSIP